MRIFGVGLLLAVLAACGQASAIQGGSGTNEGVMPVSQATTYMWKIHGSCFTGLAGGPSFRLVSDTGTIDYLAGDGGRVYLSAGNWTGEAGNYSPGDLPAIAPTFFPTPCNWTLALTPAAS